jgi:hypothetical protein
LHVRLFLARLFPHCVSFHPGGVASAAAKYGYSRQRYYQLLKRFQKEGALALESQKRGPRTNYVRTDEVERQVIRHRFLDPDATVDIIAQKLRQAGFAGLEGDVRVDGNTIIITYYNAPNPDKLYEHYENLPAKLRAERIDPRVPWLYGFELDFRFR